MSASQGLRERHSSRCLSNDGRRCTCTPSIEAFVYSKADGRKIRRTFSGAGAKSAAKAWRADALSQVNRGTLRAQSSVSVREAAETWLAGARAGVIRNRSGDAYKPSSLRAYDQALRLRVLDAVGSYRLADLRRVQAQDLVDRWIAEGHDPSTIRNSLMPLRAIYRRALARGEVALNPLSGLELPAVRGRRERIASPTEAASLIAAAPERDRALWATAFYAGLRRGELMALRWKDVDLAANLIHVRRSWDANAGEITPKSRSGTRRVPMPSLLREHLLAHLLRSGRREGLVFGRSAEVPFSPSSLGGRAATAWKRANLSAIGLHEARHTFASLMIAAGVNAKALSTYMGHASITITLDRYGHLMPGAEDEAAGLLDGYLARVGAVEGRPFIPSRLIPPRRRMRWAATRHLVLQYFRAGLSSAGKVLGQESTAQCTTGSACCRFSTATHLRCARLRQAFEQYMRGRPRCERGGRAVRQEMQTSPGMSRASTSFRTWATTCASPSDMPSPGNAPPSRYRLYSPNT